VNRKSQGIGSAIAFVLFTSNAFIIYMLIIALEKPVEALLGFVRTLLPCYFPF
jgi:hypothetical protein